jgi:hypothetical protein
MKYYLLTASRFKINRDFLDFLKPETADKETLFDSILLRCLPQFIGWLLFHVSAVGTKGRKQQFYITFVNNYFGLSRAGIKSSSMFGYGVSLTSFDTIKQEYEQTAGVLSQKRLASPNVEWWDNFSKFRSHAIPTLLKDTFASFL